MIRTSKPRDIIGEDVLKWLKNALIFAGPALIVLIGSATDLVPKEASYGVVLLYALNVATDLFRKWLSENKYETGG